jgi:hypothetical protein
MADRSGTNVAMTKARLWPSLMEATVEYPSLAEAMTEENYDCMAFTEETEDSIKLVIFEVPPTIH